MLKKGRKKGEVTFICDQRPRAKQVYLAGSFNDWAPQGQRMRRFKDGSFRTRLQLPPGDHQFKYVVDGDWLTDPAADAQVGNGSGSDNSVVQID